MRFLVFGCNGMAGHLISLYLKEQGHEVMGFARSKSKYVETILGSVQNEKLVTDIIRENHFNAIINCVGILNQFAEINKSQAAFLNSYFPHLLADITNDIDAQIIHLSTDCVFSGKRGKYTEDDFRDGETFYDRSKALGEIEDGKNITLRCSIIGPDIKPTGIGLLNWFMQQKGEVDGYKKSIWNGQTTLQLAKTIEFAAKEKINGLYNVVPDTAISKYELLKLLNYYIRNNELTIFPVDGINLDKSLKRVKWDFEYMIPDYEVMISELADWMSRHRKIYPHYKF